MHYSSVSSCSGLGRFGPPVVTVTIAGLMTFAPRRYPFWYTSWTVSSNASVSGTVATAWASSAGIISLLFIFVAYQPGAGNQTASSLQGITAMETLLPALFHLLLALSVRICKLNNPMMSHIATDLRQRHVQP